MKDRYYYLLLGFIFIITLGSRLFIAFQNKNFDPEAYFVLRNVEHIRYHFIPLFSDELSYGGRTLIFAPFYYYVLAIFNLFLPINIVSKILPNIFASSLVIIAYLISYEITKNKHAALFAALLSGFIPVFYSETIYNASIYTLVIPLTFLSLYFFMKINDNPKSVIPFLFTIALLRYTHASIILLVLAMLFYLVLVYSENLKQSKPELEVILFITFIVIWSLFIAYKKAFLMHGPFLVWQNIPQKILSSYFSDITLFEAIYQIGIIPIIFGIFIIYKYIFKEKNKSLYLLISFVVPMFFLLWFKLVELKVGLIFLGVVLVLLSAQFYKIFSTYITKTKFFRYQWLFILVLIIAFIFTSFVPSVYYALYEDKSVVNEQEINALVWLRDNTNKDDVVLATVDEGYLITYFAERRNVADPHFLLVKDINQRYNDIEAIYKTSLKTQAIKILNNYDVNYIYFSDRVKKQFNIENLGFVGDDSCFERVYADKIEIYKSRCILEER